MSAQPLDEVQTAEVKSYIFLEVNCEPRSKRSQEKIATKQLPHLGERGYAAASVGCATGGENNSK